MSPASSNTDLTQLLIRIMYRFHSATTVLRTALICSLLTVGFLVVGCDSGGSNGGGSNGSEAFSVEVQIENKAGKPIEGAEVGVRPCYIDGCVEETTAETVNMRSKRAELFSLEASVESDVVVLTWTTNTESSNAGFRIERKSNDSFEQVGFLEGAGTTTQPQTYQYRHENLLPGEYSYRLVAVETDGTERQTDPVSVEIRRRGPRVSEIQPIFPNPFSSETTVLVSLADRSEVRSTVHRLDGEKINTIVDQEVENGRHAYSWPTDERSAGIYQIRTRIQTGGEVVARDKAYAIYVGTQSDAASIGTSSADGVLSTSNQDLFPGLYDIPEIDITDTAGVVIETLRLRNPEKVQFVVTNDGDQYTFERRVVQGENNITLTIAP